MSNDSKNDIILLHIKAVRIIQKIVRKSFNSSRFINIFKKTERSANWSAWTVSLVLK